MPEQIEELTKQEWFSQATEKEDNKSLYRQFANAAEEILYLDIPEQKVIVTFFNDEKKVLNFYASQEIFGFFKYERCIKSVQIGDTLSVRFISKDQKHAYYQVATVKKCDDPELKNFFLKEFKGFIKMREGSTFGFIDDVFFSTAICHIYQLANGYWVEGNAIKTFDAKKDKWSWKAYEVNNKSQPKENDDEEDNPNTE